MAVFLLGACGGRRRPRSQALVHVFGVGRGSLVVASDGSEGLRFLTSPSHDRFSLVLFDLKTIDGLPAVRHLRDYEAHQGGSRARVLAVSANARHIPNLRETCLEAGFDDVLLVPKPLLTSRHTSSGSCPEIT